jgi:hypothetical protein
MKHIKTFESFNTDGISVDNAKFPKFNMSLRMDVQNYVDKKLDSNEYKEMFDIVGIEPPLTDSQDLNTSFDKVRELAIEYFCENPEEIKDMNINFKTYPVDSSVVPVIRESKIEISDEDMNLLNEEPLQDLVRNQKIKVLNNQISFDKNDEETIETLDIYFEFDKSNFKSDEISE